ncbi:MFS transporter [Phyllobacterium myrsinacearum]|uniref:MFS family permease n=1 Tax=Phyllobacterium myrsinacearum TaxID=28101 RepID=A0A839EKE2_9HYPH|nr:MFS transporter [Phyllobacterium myrsinacearum]MBA8879289.1 MFS family permease [Phyllobacterium myrsinacearum]
MTSTLPADGASALARPSPAFKILAFVQATLIFTIALIMIPLPKIAGEFALGSADVLLLQVAYGLPFSGLLLFGGRLADRYGGRRMFVLGLILFGGASLIAAAAPDFRVLVGMRFAQGIGGAMTAPAAMAILRILFPDPAAFGRAMATWGGVSVLGAVVGFVASGIITTWISWRWMFVIPVIVSVVGLVAACRIIPSDHFDQHAHRPGLDLGGALLATAGIVASSVGLIASEEHPWSSDMVRWPLAAGILLLIVFFLVERKARDPLLPPRFITDSRRLVGLTGMLLAAAGSVLIEFVLSLYLQRVVGWSSLMTAVSFLPFVVCLIASNQIAAGLVGRIGATPVTIIGFLISAAGLALLALMGRDAAYVSILLPGQILLAIGIAQVFSGSAVLATMNVPEHQGGLAGGVMNTTMELGPTIGLSALMSVAATQNDVVQGYAWAFGTAAVVFVVTALIGAIMIRRREIVESV